MTVTGRFKWSQFDTLIAKGFHEAAGFSKDEFERLLPAPKKEDALLVVSEACLNLQIQCALLNVDNVLDIDTGCTLNDHHNIIQQPRGLLYWRYGVENGRAMLKHSTDDAMATFEQQDRIACVTVDVLAIYREDSKVLGYKDEKTSKWVEGHYIDAAGSRLGRNKMPGLCMTDDNSDPHSLKHRPTLMASNPSDSGFNRWGPASCEKE